MARFRSSRGLVKFWRNFSHPGVGVPTIPPIPDSLEAPATDGPTVSSPELSPPPDVVDSAPDPSALSQWDPVSRTVSITNFTGTSARPPAPPPAVTQPQQPPVVTTPQQPPAPPPVVTTPRPPLAPPPVITAKDTPIITTPVSKDGPFHQGPILSKDGAGPVSHAPSTSKSTTGESILDDVSPTAPKAAPGSPVATPPPGGSTSDIVDKLGSTAADAAQAAASAPPEDAAAEAGKAVITAGVTEGVGQAIPELGGSTTPQVLGTIADVAGAATSDSAPTATSGAVTQAADAAPSAVTPGSAPATTGPIADTTGSTAPVLGESGTTQITGAPAQDAPAATTAPTQDAGATPASEAITDPSSPEPTTLSAEDAPQPQGADDGPMQAADAQAADDDQAADEASPEAAQDEATSDPSADDSADDKDTTQSPPAEDTGKQPAPAKAPPRPSRTFDDAIAAFSPQDPSQLGAQITANLQDLGGDAAAALRPVGIVAAAATATAVTGAAAASVAQALTLKSPGAAPTPAGPSPAPFDPAAVTSGAPQTSRTQPAPQASGSQPQATPSPAPSDGSAQQQPPKTLDRKPTPVAHVVPPVAADQGYVDPYKLLSTRDDGASAQPIDPHNFEWYLDQGTLLDAYNAVTDPATKKQLAVLMMHSFYKVANINIGDRLNPKPHFEGRQVSPFVPTHLGYHRSNPSNLLDKVHDAYESDLGLDKGTVHLIDNRTFGEVLAREYVTPDLTETTRVNTPGEFSDTVQELLENVDRLPPRSFDDTVLLDVSPLLDGRPENTLKDKVEALVSELEADFHRKVESFLKGKPDDQAKQDFLSKLETVVSNTHVAAFTEHHGHPLLVTPPFLQAPPAGSAPTGGPTSGQQKPYLGSSGKLFSFVTKVKESMTKSGQRIDPITAKEAWFDVVGAIEPIFTQEKVQVTKLATGLATGKDGQPPGNGIPKDPSSFQKFLAGPTTQKLKDLAKQHEQSPYISVLGQGTADLLEGLGKPGMPDINKAYNDKGLNDLLQTSLHRITTAAQEASFRPDDFFHFMNQMEVIHQQIQAMLEIARPYGDDAFSSGLLGYLGDTIPEGLTPVAELYPSAMHTLATTLAAAEALKGNNKLKIATLKDSYYESPWAISRGKTYDVWTLDGKALEDQQPIDASLTPDRPGKDGRTDRTASRDLKENKLDVFLGEFRHNVSKGRNVYALEDLEQQVDRLFDEGLVSDKFTVVIDNTVDKLRSDQVKSFLDHNADKIRDGKLNVVIMRSAQKFDMLGMDNYYGGFLYGVNDPEKFAPFNERLGNPEDRLKGLNRQGLTHLVNSAPASLDAYRSGVMGNTKAIYDALPDSFKFDPDKQTTNKDLQQYMYVAKIEGDDKQVFLDFTFKSETTMNTFDQEFRNFIAMRRLPVDDRSSFGFATSNLTIVDKEMKKIRFNPGLEGPDTRDQYVEFFNKWADIFNRGLAKGKDPIDIVMDIKAAGSLYGVSYPSDPGRSQPTSRRERLKAWVDRVLPRKKSGKSGPGKAKDPASIPGGVAPRSMNGPTNQPSSQVNAKDASQAPQEASAETGEAAADQASTMPQAQEEAAQPQGPGKKGVYALDSGPVVEKNAANLASKKGHSLVSREALGSLGSRDKLTLVGHGEPGLFGGMTPEGLAAHLKGAKVSALGTLSLKGCDSADFARQLMQELKKQDISVDRITGRDGLVTITSQGRTLVLDGERWMNKAPRAKVEITPGKDGAVTSKDPYASNDWTEADERSVPLREGMNAGSLGNEDLTVPADFETTVHAFNEATKGIRVLVTTGPNLGNQAAALSLLRNLRRSGFNKPVEVLVDTKAQPWDQSISFKLALNGKYGDKDAVFGAVEEKLRARYGEDATISVERERGNFKEIRVEVDRSDQLQALEDESLFTALQDLPYAYTADLDPGELEVDDDLLTGNAERGEEDLATYKLSVTVDVSTQSEIALHDKLLTLDPGYQSSELYGNVKWRFEASGDPEPSFAEDVSDDPTVVGFLAGGEFGESSMEPYREKLNTHAIAALQPLLWHPENRYIKLKDQEPQPLAVPQTAAYFADRIEPSDVRQFLLEQAGPDRAEGLTRILDKVDSGDYELMTVYGVHQAHDSTPKNVLENLVAAVQHGQGEGLKKTVVLVIAKEGVDLDVQADGLHTAVADPTLASKVDELAGDGNVLVVRVPPLPQSVFQLFAQKSTLPIVVEGANTSNLVQMLGKPYLSVSTRNTPYVAVPGSAEGHSQLEALTTLVNDAVTRTSADKRAQLADYFKAARQPDTALGGYFSQLQAHVQQPALDQTQWAMYRLEKALRPQDASDITTGASFSQPTSAAPQPGQSGPTPSRLGSKLGTGGRGLSGLVANKGAGEREQELAQKYNLQIGRGDASDGKHFSHKMLDRIEKVLGELPAEHVNGNPTLRAIIRELSAERAESSYNSLTDTIHVVNPLGMPSWLYSRLNRGVGWQRDRMDRGALDGYAGISKEQDKELGLTGPREVMGGVSDVLANGNLVKWTMRHEIGHSIDKLVGWEDGLSGEDRFGGWQKYPEADDRLDVARALLAKAGITDEEANRTLGNQSLLRYFATSISPSSLRNSTKSLDAFPGIAAHDDPALKDKLGQAIRTVKIALAQPWTLPDGGAHELTVDGRVYQVDAYDQWVSYRAEARETAVSNYQLSTPAEWFAETYAAYFDPTGAPRERLHPDVRDFFENELPRRVAEARAARQSSDQGPEGEAWQGPGESGASSAAAVTSGMRAPAEQPAPSAESSAAASATPSQGTAMGAEQAASLEKLLEASKSWSHPPMDADRQEAKELLGDLMRSQGADAALVDRLAKLIDDPGSLSQSEFAICALHSALHTQLTSDLGGFARVVAAEFTGKLFDRGGNQIAAFPVDPKGKTGAATSAQGAGSIQRVIRGEAAVKDAGIGNKLLLNGIKKAAARRADLESKGRALSDEHTLDFLLARGMGKMLSKLAPDEYQRDAENTAKVIPGYLDKAPTRPKDAAGASKKRGDLLLSASSLVTLFNTILGGHAQTMAAGASYDVARINDVLSRPDQAPFALATFLDGKALFERAQDFAKDPTQSRPFEDAGTGDTSSAHQVVINGPITEDGDYYNVPLHSWQKSFSIKVKKDALPSLFPAFTYGTLAPSASTRPQASKSSAPGEALTGGVTGSPESSENSSVNPALVGTAVALGGAAAYALYTTLKRGSQPPPAPQAPPYREVADPASYPDVDKGVADFMEYLDGGQNPKVRFYVDSTKGMGHQASSAQLMRRLTQPVEQGGLDYSGIIQVSHAEDPQMLDKLKLLLPEVDFKGTGPFRLNKATLEFIDYPADKTEQPVNLGFTGGADGNDPFASDLKVKYFLRLQPYLWDESDQIQFADGSPAVELRKESVLGKDQFKYAAVHQPMPAAPDWDSYHGGPYEKHAEIVRFLTENLDKVDVAPLYGIRRDTRTMNTEHHAPLFTAAVGALDAQLGDDGKPIEGRKPAVLLNISNMNETDLKTLEELLAGGQSHTEMMDAGNAGKRPAEYEPESQKQRAKYLSDIKALERIKLHPAPSDGPEGSTIADLMAKLSRDELEQAIDSLKGDAGVVVVQLDKLPPELFNHLFAVAELPGVFEGQSTAAQALRVGKPYLHVSGSHYGGLDDPGNSGALMYPSLQDDGSAAASIQTVANQMSVPLNAWSAEKNPAKKVGDFIKQTKNPNSDVARYFSEIKQTYSQEKNDKFKRSINLLEHVRHRRENPPAEATSKAAPTPATAIPTGMQPSPESAEGSAATSANRDRLGTGGRGLAGLVVNKGAAERERQLAEKYNLEIGPGDSGEGKHFSHKMLDRIEKVLGELPAEHVNGNPTLREIVRAIAAEHSASAYDESTDTVHVVNPMGMPSWLYSRLNRGVSWQRYLMDYGAMAAYEGIRKEQDKALGITGRREVMGGVSEVLANGNLVKWTMRHEIGHSIDKLIDWRDSLAAEDRFGGWQVYSDADDRVDVARALFAKAGITDEEANRTLGNQSLLRYFATLISPSSVRATDASLEAFPGIAANNDPILKSKLGQAIRTVKIALAQPWTLSDGGAQELTVDGRIYQVDHYDDWGSYRAEARETAVSNYQLSTPAEWFAETYAAHFDPSGAPRERLHLDVRDFFENELPLRVAEARAARQSSDQGAEGQPSPDAAQGGESSALAIPTGFNPATDAPAAAVKGAESARDTSSARHGDNGLARLAQEAATAMKDSIVAAAKERVADAPQVFAIGKVDAGLVRSAEAAALAMKNQITAAAKGSPAAVISASTDVATAHLAQAAAVAMTDRITAAVKGAGRSALDSAQLDGALSRIARDTAAVVMNRALEVRDAAVSDAFLDAIAEALAARKTCGC